MVEQQVKLDRSLGSLELGPIEDRCAEIDGGRIEREQRASEAESMSWGDGVATCVQTVKDILVQAPRSMGMRVRQRRALGWCGDPELLESPLGTRQSLFDLTQRLGSSELTKDHRHELGPRAETLRPSIRPVPVGQLLELSTRNQLENLLENATESLHRRAPPCFELRQPDSTETRRSSTSHLTLFWTGVVRDGFHVC